MTRAVDGEGDRTHIYYCHPYSAYERGSNENGNRMIRRRVPKGTDFTRITEETHWRSNDGETNTHAAYSAGSVPGGYCWSLPKKPG